MNPPPYRGRLLHALSRFGSLFAATLIAGLLIHTAVMGLDYLLGASQVQLDLQRDFFGSLFAFPMLPVIAAYALLSLLAYLFWQRARKTLLQVHEQTVQAERERATVEVLQKTTGLLAEHLAAHNREILAWIEHRKGTGHQVSPRIEQASQKISASLHTLFDLAFVQPHRNGQPLTGEQLQNFLEEKLGQVSQPTSSPAENNPSPEHRSQGADPHGA